MRGELGQALGAIAQSLMSEIAGLKEGWKALLEAEGGED
jgi:hypothetical protein